MALQPLATKISLNVFPHTWAIASTTRTMDAVGESFAIIGKVYLEGKTGSKTFSSAGGKLVFKTATGVVFSNAGTNVRIGIQGVAATGLEDTSWSVYADFVGGSGAFATNTWYEKSMTNGSISISHGQEIAIVFEMTARGGTDVFSISTWGVQQNANTVSNYPYITQDTGSGPVRSGTNIRAVGIIFDDSTIGWIDLAEIIPNGESASTFNFNMNSTPDEYAFSFSLPFRCRISDVALFIGSIASTDNFEIILYSDPLGTPNAERTIAVDPNKTGNTSSVGPYWVNLGTSYVIEPNTTYAVALRPTTANSITMQYVALGSFAEDWKKVTNYGMEIEVLQRTNQTGSFTLQSNKSIPYGSIQIEAIDDGAVSGGNTYSRGRIVNGN